MQYKVCSTKYARRESSFPHTPDTGVRRRPTPVHSREEEDPRPVHSRTCFQSRRPVHRICSPTRMCVLLSLAPTPHAHSPQMSLRASAAELFLSGQSHVRTSAYRARSCSRHVWSPSSAAQERGRRRRPLRACNKRRAQGAVALARPRAAAPHAQPSHWLAVLRTHTPCAGLVRALLLARNRATMPIAAKRGHSGVNAWHCRVACCLTAPHLYPTWSLSRALPIPASLICTCALCNLPHKCVTFQHKPLGSHFKVTQNDVFLEFNCKCVNKARTLACAQFEAIFIYVALF